MLVPFDLMHLGLGADVQNIPPWLAKSVLAEQLSDATEFEHLLTVLACTAASCFLQAGVLRHATYLASLAANYLFRAVCIAFLQCVTVLVCAFSGLSWRVSALCCHASEGPPSVLLEWCSFDM